MRDINIFKPMAYLQGAVSGASMALLNPLSPSKWLFQTLLLPEVIFAEQSYHNNTIASYAISFEACLIVNYFNKVLNSNNPSDILNAIHFTGLNFCEYALMRLGTEVIRDAFELDVQQECDMLPVYKAIKTPVCNENETQVAVPSCDNVQCGYGVVPVYNIYNYTNNYSDSYDY